MVFLFWPTAPWVNLREMQHIHFLSVTQQIFNYFSSRGTWDLFRFSGNNCHTANSEKSWRLQKKKKGGEGELWEFSWFLGDNWRPQSTHELTLAAVTSSCCQGHETLVRRVMHACRSGSICGVWEKEKKHGYRMKKLTKRQGRGKVKD